MKNSSLYVEGLLQDSIKVQEKEFLEVSFDAVVKNSGCPPPNDSSFNFNWATFENSANHYKDYQIQFFTNEYFINNGFWAAFYADMLNMTAPIPTTGTLKITTSTINLVLFGAMNRAGYADDMPCQLMVKANPNDKPPTVKFRNKQSDPMSFEGSFWLDIQCRKYPNSELYFQVFTIETNRFQFDATMEIVGTIFKIKIANFNFEINRIFQDTVGISSNTDFYNLLITAFRSPILMVINNYMYNEGLSIDKILATAHLDFIQFGDTSIDF